VLSIKENVLLKKTTKRLLFPVLRHERGLATNREAAQKNKSLLLLFSRKEGLI
jgi:hypothetical protein